MGTGAAGTTIAGPRRDAGIFAFERATDEQKALVVLNTGDVDAESCAPANEGGACALTSFPAGTVLTDIMPGGTGETFTVKADGTIAVPVTARSGRVLIRN